ncbi:MAG TPA: SRPBCC family protein, partial [Tepidisphaeraceae bacterium]|nr:SRPBCC family protein [Tepidisphaeraceae bacterium]
SGQQEGIAMIRSHSARMSSRREWLLGAGLAASIAVLPAAATGRPSSGKDDVMRDIMHLIRIHASAERVYAAITTADGLRQWWTRDAAIEPQVGAAGEFGFYGRRFVAKVTVEELRPAAHVRWKVTNSAWQGDDIEFDLKGDGNDTTLLFVHRGFPRADDKYATATTRWGFYLLSLKRYLQAGTGTPNPDDGELG